MLQFSQLPTLLLLVLPQLMDAKKTNCIPEQCMTRGELIVLIRKLEKELGKLKDMGSGKDPCGPQPPQPTSVRPTIPPEVESTKPPTPESTGLPAVESTKPSAPEPTEPPAVESTKPTVKESTVPPIVESTFMEQRTESPTVEMTTKFPDDGSDKNCSKITCGINARCFIGDRGQLHCVCEQHFIGNPIEGCTTKTKSAWILDGPHFKTFDGQHYEYRGTCPFTFIRPCDWKYKPGAPWHTFEVLGLSKEDHRYPAATKLQEIEVHVNSTNIYIDEHENVYVDGIKRRLPFFFPSHLKPEIFIFRKPTSVVVTDHKFKIEFSHRGWLKVDIPDIAELRGPNTLCGLAGNPDGNCENDLRFPEGVVWKNDHSKRECTLGHFRLDPNKAAEVDEYGDSYYEIAPKHVYLKPPIDCLSGHVLRKLIPKCDREDIEPDSRFCSPIDDARLHRGPFQNCSALGDVIAILYRQCLKDLCGRKKSCTAMDAFARLCQTEIPNTPLNWKALADCGEPRCPPHSKFSTCAPGCRKTCSQPNGPKICTQSCAAGCFCDDGYIWDDGKCMPFSKCGCNDQYGENHPDPSQWLSEDCLTRYDCTHGKIQSSPAQPCHQNAHCGATANHIRGCVCNTCFEGDGYTCEKCTSCSSKKLCGADQGHGRCEPTKDGHKCSCNDPWTGPNCAVSSHPRQNCQDLKKYHNITESGYYRVYDGRVRLVYCKF